MRNSWDASELGLRYFAKRARDPWYCVVFQFPRAGYLGALHHPHSSGMIFSRPVYLTAGGELVSKVYWRSVLRWWKCILWFIMSRWNAFYILAIVKLREKINGEHVLYNLTNFPAMRTLCSVKCIFDKNEGGISQHVQEKWFNVRVLKSVELIRHAFCGSRIASQRAVGHWDRPRYSWGRAVHGSGSAYLYYITRCSCPARSDRCIAVPEI